MQKTFVSVCLSYVYLFKFWNDCDKMRVYEKKAKAKSTHTNTQHHIKNVNVALKEKQTKQQNDSENQTNKCISVYTKDKLPWRKWFGRLLLIFSFFLYVRTKCRQIE